MNGWNGMEINRINNESMACVYEDVTIGWWKNCNEADDVYVTGITRDPDIEWKNINVVDLKLCKDQAILSSYLNTINRNPFFFP